MQGLGVGQLQVEFGVDVLAVVCNGDGPAALVRVPYDLRRLLRFKGDSCWGGSGGGVGGDVRVALRR